MSDLNLFGHIEAAIDRYFSFLQDRGFGRFQDRQLAYEYHFIASNDRVKIDIWFEATISTPIWVRIDDFYIESLEPENTVFKDLAQKRESLLLSNRSFDDFVREENYERYRLFGRGLNDEYLQEAAQILQRNSHVLNGDFSRLTADLERQLIDRQSEEAIRKRQEKIYTSEFNSCFGECYYESKSIDEIATYLQAQSLEIGITNVRLYDWDNNLIPFDLD
jgi:hypothetical protein